MFLLCARYLSDALRVAFFLASSLHLHAAQHHRHRSDVALDARMSNPLPDLLLPCACSDDDIYLGRIVTLMPMLYAARWKKNIYVSMAVHLLGNVFVMLLMLPVLLG